MKKLFSVLAALSLSLSVLAQVEVKGTVTEAGTGEPVIGASVMVQGTTTGTITDLNGVYSLSVPADAVLSFDCIGFKG